jgi:hypothetical protein
MIDIVYECCIRGMVLCDNIIIILYFIIFCGSAPQRGLWPRPRGFLITHNDVPQSVGPLWTSDQLVAETLSDNIQHIQQTNVHTPGGIRTHDRRSKKIAKQPSETSGWPYRTLSYVNIGYCETF